MGMTGLRGRSLLVAAPLFRLLEFTLFEARGGVCREPPRVALGSPVRTAGAYEEKNDRRCCDKDIARQGKIGQQQ